MSKKRPWLATEEPAITTERLIKAWHGDGVGQNLLRFRDLPLVLPPLFRVDVTLRNGDRGNPAIVAGG